MEKKVREKLAAVGNKNDQRLLSAGCSKNRMRWLVSRELPAVLSTSVMKK